MLRDLDGGSQSDDGDSDDEDDADASDSDDEDDADVSDRGADEPDTETFADALAEAFKTHKMIIPRKQVYI